MNGWLTAVLSAGALLAAVWTAVRAARDLRVNDAVLYTLAALELLVLVQLVLGFVLLARDDGGRLDSTATFVSYLVSVPFVLPIGTFWSLVERSRPSMLVLTVVCLAVAAMEARLWQMWAL